MSTGDIGALLDTHTYDAVKGRAASLIQISSDLHCVVYQGPDNHGWSRSINITSLGIISEPPSNTLEFNTVGASSTYSSLRTPNVDCIVYGDNLLNGQLEAIIVASNGTISQHAAHRSKFADTNCVAFDIIHISGSVIAIVYRSNIYDLRVSTWTISDTGQVSAAYIQDFLVEDISILWPQIAHVGGNVYVVTYQLGDGTGHARTINITAAGAISFTASPEVEIENTWMANASLIKMKPGVFLTAHSVQNGDGWSAVFEVSDAGVISVPTNNLYEWDTSNGERPWAIRISDEVFAVVYQGKDDDGYLKTVKCEVASAATWSTVGALEFQTSDITRPAINHRGGNTYIITYTNIADLGVMKTYAIEGPPLPAVAQHLMIMGVG